MTTATSEGRLDLRELTITTAIAYEAQAALADVPDGGSLQLVVGRAPAILPDLEAWARARGLATSVVGSDGDGQVLRVTKRPEQINGRRVAMVVSQDGLEELLSPLAFALAAALEGAQVSVYIQGPAVHVLRPGFSPALPWPMRPFSRFARNGLAASGHVAAIEKLRQLQRLGGRIYACGPSLEHFKVSATDLALEDVVVCEYLTFMAVMQEADVQLYP